MKNVRKPLKPNTEINVVNHEGARIRFVVEHISGFGGSCIVYDGYCWNNAGKKHAVKIKECYPHQLSLERNPSGALIVSEQEKEKFEKMKARVRRFFDITNELHETTGLRNVTANVFDRYEANNTVYIVSSFEEGSCMSAYEFASVKDVLRAVCSTAKSIERLHKQGYLYLDVKPENVFVYPETPDLIRLFDFDSILPMNGEDTADYRLAYSNGFSPLEQKLGKKALLGRHSDVYSIGALLFYLLFGRTPGALDCGADAEYDYQQWKWDSILQEKAYRELTTFFQNTLQPYHRDRYETMEEAVSQLEVILKYADLPVPVICSTSISQHGIMIGREKERQRLQEWFWGTEQLLFVTGMGGIGKSTIVRKFIQDHRDQFDHVVYLQFHESMKETLADDNQFIISGCEKDETESTEQYVRRKLKLAGELAENHKALMVIDNFDGVIDDSFQSLRIVGWKILAVTREDMQNSGYAVEIIKEFSEKQELQQLFEAYLGRKLNAQELPIFEKLVNLAAGHTLILVLLAKQISKSYLQMVEALKLMKDYGFSNMAPEKVNYVQDGTVFYGKISMLLKAVYDTSKLSSEEKQCLKILSLFDTPGIPIREAKNLLEVETLDPINELQESGWLEIEESCVSMHPLIRETIHQMEWTEECRAIILKKMNRLLGNIRKNVKKESDKKIFRESLTMAKSILRHCKKDEKLWAKSICKELMFVTLKNLPKDQEEYIIENADLLFYDTFYQNPQGQMELYDYVVYLLCQKKDYTKAKHYLREAFAFAKKKRTHYLWGLYYDMQADFYEEMLAGVYDPQTTNEEDLLNRMVRSVDEAVKHMERVISKKGKNLYVKYVLGKAALLIRSKPERAYEIRTLIRGTKPIIKQYARENPEVRAVYHMVWAWYYTLCELQESFLMAHLKEAKRNFEKRQKSALEFIDDYWIPAANMMWEQGNVKRAIRYLEEAVRICEEHQALEPYNRKKQELLNHEEAVYASAGDTDKCQSILERMKR